MTIYQIRRNGYLLDRGEYYKYLYFEFPYHLFNVVAFIVIMQWIQLWAVLSEANESSSRESESEKEQEIAKKKQVPNYKKFIRFIRQRFFEGKTYYVILYGTVIVVLSFLVMDTIFLSIDQTVRNKQLNTTFEVFTFMLMIFGIVLCADYIITYIVIQIQFSLLDPKIRKKLSKNMNAFFIMMILLLGSRTIYYLFFRFKNFHYEPDQEIDNSQLIFIYCEEIFFNFVVFYNLVLKQNHEDHFEDKYQKCQAKKMGYEFGCENGIDNSSSDSLLSNDKSIDINNKSIEQLSKMNQFHRKEQSDLNHKNSKNNGGGDQYQHFEEGRVSRIKTLTEEEDEESGKRYSDSQDNDGGSSSQREGFKFQQPLYSPSSMKRVTYGAFNMSVGTDRKLSHQNSIKNQQQNSDNDNRQIEKSLESHQLTSNNDSSQLKNQQESQGSGIDSNNNDDSNQEQQRIRVLGQNYQQQQQDNRVSNPNISSSFILALADQSKHD